MARVRQQVRTEWGTLSNELMSFERWPEHASATKYYHGERNFRSRDSEYHLYAPPKVSSTISGVHIQQC